MRTLALCHRSAGILMALSAATACGGDSSGPSSPTLNEIVVTPDSIALPTGGSQQFEVTGRMDNGSTTVVAATFTATGGTVSASGLYTAGPVAGAFRVIAMQAGATLADTSLVTITEPPVLTAISLTPDSVVLPAGGVQQFEVTGRMNDGSTTAAAATFTATGGTVSASGLYTAGPVAGAFRVIAMQAGATLADTSLVTITEPPVLTAIFLAPDSATLWLGESQRFTVTGQMSDGSTIIPSVSYEATGGTITGDGFYTAALQEGVYQVIARQLGGTLADTSAVHIAVSPGSWFQVAPLPHTTEGGAVGVIDSILYAVGGERGNLNFLASLEAYDFRTDTWTTRAPMPTAREGLGVGVVNGKLYAIGGFDWLDTANGFGWRYFGTVEAYDPATDTWTTRAPMPTPRSDFVVGVIDGIIYAIGGWSSDTLVTTVEAYDPASNLWTTKAPMSMPLVYAAGGVVDGVLYIAGGTSGTEYETAIQAYNPATESWTMGPALSVRIAPAVVVIDGTMYVIGGTSGSALTTVVSFTPKTGTMEKRASMLSPRDYFGAGVVSGYIIAVGGSTGTSRLSSVEAYQP